MSAPEAVRAVLWDADGVLQDVPAPWSMLLADVIGPSAAHDLLTDVWPVAQQAMRGRAELHRDLEELLERHGVRDVGAQVREVWGTFESYDRTRDLVAEVRRGGTGCHLATNQDQLRASYMRERLGYQDLFDSCFYSCDLGVAKPDPGFFEHILRVLGVSPAQAVFVDDTEANVVAAREMGLGAIWWHAREGVGPLREQLAQAGVPLAGA